MIFLAVFGVVRRRLFCRDGQQGGIYFTCCPGDGFLRLRALRLLGPLVPLILIPISVPILLSLALLLSLAFEVARAIYVSLAG